MNTALGRFAAALKRRLWLNPRGYGRPIDKTILDHEYRSGSWDHFFAWDELPRNLILVGAIQHFYPHAATVLDVGCGNGRLAQLLQPHPFAHYVGVDISGEAVARASALDLRNSEFVEANIETWRPTGQFDAVIFNESLGYLKDPKAVLAALTPGLRLGGRFFISLHRYGNSEAQWQRILKVAAIDTATTVTSAEGKVWDIRILHPITATAR